MIIGTPKEIKNNENRVGLTPAGVKELVKNGHTVLIEKNAGSGSGFMNEEYKNSGAKIVNQAKSLYEKSDMIVKVKEPLKEEYKLIRANQIVFTYFHFASNVELTKAMVKSKAICIAYETVKDNQNRLPLLTPMSEIAGRMSIQQGAKYLEKPQKGRGILLGGVPGVAPAHVSIIGAGVVGTEAAKMAAGLGAKVTVLDINMDRLRYLSDTLPANVTTLASNSYNIQSELCLADLVIGAVLIPGAKAPKLIKKSDLKLMKKGAVIVDVAIDQGGCIETARPTTHENPTYLVNNILHYCVANIPGAVPVTSTTALTNVTLPHILQIANKGWEIACKENDAINNGLEIKSGKIINQFLI